MSDTRFQDRVCCRSHPDAQMISDYTSGNLVCSKCGLVVGDRLVDPGGEWRNCGEGADKSRVGKAEDMYFDGSDLSTLIGPSPLGGNGTKYLKSTSSPKERAFKAACKDIENAADRVNLSAAVIETAVGIYKEVTDKKTFTGSHRDALGICCLYIACRQKQVPQSLEEICGTSHSTRKQVAKCYKEVMKHCKLIDPVQVREKDFVDRYGRAFELDQEAIKVGRHLAEAATKSDLFPSSGPDLIGATAVVVVSALSGRKITFQEVVQMNTGITKHAITDAYKKMLTGLETKKDEFLPNDFKPKLKREVGRTRDPSSKQILNGYEKPGRPFTGPGSVKNISGVSAPLKSAREARPVTKYGAPISAAKPVRASTSARQPDRDMPRNKALQPTVAPRGSPEDENSRVSRLPSRMGTFVPRFRKTYPEGIQHWVKGPRRTWINHFTSSKHRDSSSCRKPRLHLLRHCCQEYSRLHLERGHVKSCLESSRQFANDISLFRIRWEKKTAKAFQALLSNKEDSVLWKLRSEEECHLMWTKWDSLDDLTPFRKQLKDVVPVVTLENFVDDLLQFPIPREWVPKDGAAVPADYWLFVESARNTTWNDLREVFVELSPMYDNYPASYFEKDYRTLIEKKEGPLLRSLRRRDVLLVTRLCRLGCTANLREATWSLLLRDKTYEKSQYQKLLCSVLKHESFADWISLFAVAESVGNSDQFFNFVTQTQQVLLLFLRDEIMRQSLPESSEKITDKIDPSSRKPEDHRRTSLPFHEFPMYAAPLAYVCLQTSPAYFMFRELYSRYFHYLHEISTHPQSILSLYALFESLLYTKEPSIWEHLRVTLGFHPGAYVMPWIVMAFSGYIEIDQILLLWDRIIGYNDLRILTLLSLGIFISRGRVILKCSTCRDVGVVLSDIFNIQIVPLLQVVLFS